MTPPAGSIRLEIDGGVKVDNIREIAEAGADTFVAGSAIFSAGKDSDPNRYDSVVKAMRAELAKVKINKWNRWRARWRRSRWP